MLDLIVAYAVMLTLSLTLGILAATKLCPSTRDSMILWLTLAVVSMFAYALNVAGQLYLARFVNTSAAIVWTNLSPLFAGLAAGWASQLPGIPPMRRYFLSGLLSVGVLIALFWPHIQIFLRPPPEGDPNRMFVMATQSAPATCSPAAATTLLRYEGIEASEAEMIPLCLTEAKGTPTLGLYRGIKIKADRENRKVEIVHASLDELLESDDWPILLTVKLPIDAVVDPRYEEQWGWIPGTGHSVVALRRDPSGGIVIGDPAAGVEVWMEKDMNTLWHGEGIRLAGDRTDPMPGAQLELLGAEPDRGSDEQ